MKLPVSTFMKLLIWFAPMVISLSAMYFVVKAESPRLPNLVRVSTEIEEKVDALAALPNIQAAGVVFVDTQKNERMMLTYRVNDTDLAWLLRKYIVMYGFKVPLFESEHGYEDMVKIVEVLNGGSVCVPSMNLVMFRKMPDLAKHVGSACFFGMAYIDPRYRHYILVFTKEPMSIKDFDEHGFLIDSTRQKLFLSWIQDIQG